jgi:hypothetical protein
VNEQLTESIQQAASGKVGVLVGAGGITANSWWDFLVGEPAQAVVIVLGLLVSLTVIAVNLWSLYQSPAKIKRQKLELRNTRLENALLEEKAIKAGIDLDSLN